MVAFGETLENVKATSSLPPSAYLEYQSLKGMIYDLQLLNLREPVDENAMSLSVTPATNAAGMPEKLIWDEDDSEDEGVRRRERAGRLRSQMSQESGGMSDCEEMIPITHEAFLVKLEDELKKMDRFTHEEVIKIRKTLRELEAYSTKEIGTNREDFSERCSAVGAHFLEIEKYVNLNVTAVRKLLKKHDKVLPTLPPIKAFYIARMHDMRWVRNDYSDVVVRLSSLYNASSLTTQEDNNKQDKQYDDQSFVRTTSKFWVKPGDLSAVKLTISKHLPVFLQPATIATEEISHTKAKSKDSQLVNSVYLDSSTLELYHARLAKSPGAVALRLRWYGSGEPTLVFVERKTHRDSWTGDESVKERFAIAPEQVPLLLRGDFDAHAHENKLRSHGTKSEAAIKYETKLVDEIAQLIRTKRLVPTVRSQCSRCAFQLPHTNAVRASVDTNLCLINEVGHAIPPQPESLLGINNDQTKVAFDEKSMEGFKPAQRVKSMEEKKQDAHDAIQQDRWYRDPKTSIPRNEITRFPFAVLEIKLSLGDNDELPAWVRELTNSKKLIPCHKFSKFIHGCAVLLPDEIQAAPYWIDDPALAISIRASGPAASSLLRNVSPLDAVRGRGIGSRAPTVEHDAAHIQEITPRGGPDEEAPAIINEDTEFFPTDQADFCFSLRHFCDDKRSLPRALYYDRGTQQSCCPTPEQIDPRSEMQKLFPTQKIEPKLFFAAERTFIHWLHSAVILAGFGSVAFAATHPKKKKHWYSDDEFVQARTSLNARVTIYATALSMAAILIAIYAAAVLNWRLERIATRSPTEWGDPLGPIVIGSVAIFLIATVWFTELAHFF
uniref:SPX domain-containing protein n=1 Tax=Aureoumbra lagunensis TaxID=44058 RepID=A0A7S3JV42_9STRA|mmetsp:Transcript_14071/g.21241  ORF Transcript_14071/g.21241 Transcript_14071/m.21241 type:complete len:835 (+) Transcript_14071:75-2579(+)|eukprot:CAMPEP_0197321532 /NCGR_PEP_ID=MMETSP0891-20130614/65264_1 /TAXON_ID=44058 ORGANISM="Aureoumbra lagunensis, Strain CCMP1510" /NCGR_SAMPLE_ID=MMETSP0891 /ASSEMBLY_ACC=CAM_ASM_000534 /LENGTH=834 /DNA_ID=CAMNT_0042813457 /DNA_START=63 /DNA_END=2567 /DNA_ORIENTATION=-